MMAIVACGNESTASFGKLWRRLVSTFLARVGAARQAQHDPSPRRPDFNQVHSAATGRRQHSTTNSFLYIKAIVQASDYTDSSSNAFFDPHQSGCTCIHCVSTRTFDYLSVQVDHDTIDAPNNNVTNNKYIPIQNVGQ